MNAAAHALVAATAPSMVSIMASRRPSLDSTNRFANALQGLGIQKGDKVCLLMTNRPEFLEATIRSVLLQGYPALEYIVVDGGSTDESASIIERYAGWLSYWVSEPDRGQSHAVNKGLARFGGEAFTWVNSDDQLLQRLGRVFNYPVLIIIRCFEAAL